jgi:hypothetical protein
VNVLAGAGDLPAQCWHGCAVYSAGWGGCAVLQAGGGGGIRAGYVGASMDGNGVAATMRVRVADTPLLAGLINGRRVP